MPTQYQDHIHLSLETGAGDSPEFAPPDKWSVRFPGRMDVPEVIMTLKRARNGKLWNHVLSSSGEPIQFQNYRYIIVVRARDGDTLEDRITLLKSFNGKTVFLIDSLHPDDGEAHGLIRTMICQVGEFRNSSQPVPEWFEVEVTLTDLDTAI